MPQPINLTKAELREIEWYGDKQDQVRETTPKKRVTVQFNPETLKVAFANQKAGGDQPGGSAIQFVGTGSTKLTLDLWFDVTVPLADKSLQPQGDVRRLTKEIAYFITPKPVAKKKDQFIPPGVQFLWGTFLFNGVMDSMNETIEFFSEEGKPLRATISIALSRQEIQFNFGDQKPPPPGASPNDDNKAAGTQPVQAAKDGDNLQKMAGQQGNPQEWKQIALANGIENPRRLPAGTLINMSRK